MVASNSDGPNDIRSLRFYIMADYQRLGRKANPLNPAVTTVVAFRVSQLLWRRGARPLAKLVEWFLVHTVSSQLASSARVGPGLALPHPVGIIVGSSAKIGRNVTLGQNVTLGSNYGREKDGRRQPILGNGVRVSAGATLAGPIYIGEGAVVGANAVVSIDVPYRSVVRAARSVIVADQSETAVGREAD